MVADVLTTRFASRLAPTGGLCSGQNLRQNTTPVGARLAREGAGAVSGHL